MKHTATRHRDTQKGGGVWHTAFACMLSMFLCARRFQEAGEPPKRPQEAGNMADGCPRTFPLSIASFRLPQRPTPRQCFSQRANHRPCRNLSPSFILPNSHALSRPSSDRSIPLTEDMSCTGGLLTLEATMTGSVSRMMPSSIISSIARETRS